MAGRHGADVTLATTTPTIEQADDLQLPYPGTGGTAMMLHVNVTPANEAPYPASTPALILASSLPKYSAGRQIHVRYDAKNPFRVMVDPERNRDLPN